MAEDDILSIVTPEPAAGGESSVHGENESEGAPTSLEEGATPESEAQAAEAEGEESKPEPKKSGLEKRFGELTGKAREAEARAEFLRGQNEALMKLVQEGRIAPPQPGQGEPQALPPDPEPQMQTFKGSYEEFLREHTAWTARKVVRDEIVAQQEQAKQAYQQHQQHQAMAERQAKVSDFYGKGEQAFPDFRSVFHPGLPVTQQMADAILEEPEGPLVAVYLGKKPDEAARISKLPPMRQVMEIGRISERIAAAKAAKGATNAPDPINPISGKGRVNDFDPNQGPKDIDAWMKWDREKRQKRK